MLRLHQRWWVNKGAWISAEAHQRWWVNKGAQISAEAHQEQWVNKGAHQPLSRTGVRWFCNFFPSMQQPSIVTTTLLRIRTDKDKSVNSQFAFRNQCGQAKTTGFISAESAPPCWGAGRFCVSESGVRGWLRSKMTTTTWLLKQAIPPFSERLKITLRPHSRPSVYIPAWHVKVAFMLKLSFRFWRHGCFQLHRQQRFRHPDWPGAAMVTGDRHRRAKWRHKNQQLRAGCQCCNAIGYCHPAIGHYSGQWLEVKQEGWGAVPAGLCSVCGSVLSQWTECVWVFESSTLSQTAVM